MVLFLLLSAAVGIANMSPIHTSVSISKQIANEQPTARDVRNSNFISVLVRFFGKLGFG